MGQKQSVTWQTGWQDKQDRPLLSSLNLGAGAEMGLYYKDGDFTSQFIWKAAEQNMRTRNELVLDYKRTENVFAYYPGAPQWWTTGFNPDYQNVNADDLYAKGRMDFSARPDLFDAFYNEHKYNSNLTFNKDSKTVILRW
jgi:hypothetical protein